MALTLRAGRQFTIVAASAAVALWLGTVGCSEGADEPADTADEGTGGTTDDGDEPSEGGSDGTGGSEVTGPTALFAFDNDLERFAFEPYQGGEDEPTNLYAESTMTWTGDQGKPDMGSIKLEVPFDGYKQAITVQYNYDAPIDLSGKILTVQVMLESGFNQDPSYPGGILFFLKTGEDWVYGQAEWTNIDRMGTWVEYTFTVDQAETFDGEPTAFDPTAVRSIGVSLNTGSGAAEDADPPPTPPAPAVFYIDTFAYTPS